MGFFSSLDPTGENFLGLGPTTGRVASGVVTGGASELFRTNAFGIPSKTIGGKIIRGVAGGVEGAAGGFVIGGFPGAAAGFVAGGITSGLGGTNSRTLSGFGENFGIGVGAGAVTGAIYGSGVSGHLVDVYAASHANAAATVAAKPGIIVSSLKTTAATIGTTTLATAATTAQQAALNGLQRIPTGAQNIILGPGSAPSGTGVTPDVGPSAGPVVYPQVVQAGGGSPVGVSSFGGGTTYLILAGAAVLAFMFFKRKHA